MKGLDIVGLSLILLSLVLVFAFGVTQSNPEMGGDSLNDLGPVWPGVIGLVLVIVARITRRKA